MVWLGDILHIHAGIGTTRRSCSPYRSLIMNCKGRRHALPAGLGHFGGGADNTMLSLAIVYSHIHQHAWMGHGLVVCENNCGIYSGSKCTGLV